MPYNRRGCLNVVAMELILGSAKIAAEMGLPWLQHANASPANAGVADIKLNESGALGGEVRPALKKWPARLS
jgi:hypothetical protein